MRQQKLGRHPYSQRAGLAASHWIKISQHHTMPLKLYKLMHTEIKWVPAWLDSLLHLIALHHEAVEWADSVLTFPWGIRKPSNDYRGILTLKKPGNQRLKEARSCFLCPLFSQYIILHEVCLVVRLCYIHWPSHCQNNLLLQNLYDHISFFSKFY